MTNPRNKTLLEEASNIASQAFASKPTPETLSWHLHEFLMQTYGSDWLQATLSRHKHPTGDLYSATLFKHLQLF